MLVIVLHKDAASLCKDAIEINRISRDIKEML
jgi:hypothetical protein